MGLSVVISTYIVARKDAAGQEVKPVRPTYGLEWAARYSCPSSFTCDPSWNIRIVWRRWMGIEPTTHVRQVTGFEDQGSHQTSITSIEPVLSAKLPEIAHADRNTCRIKMLDKGQDVLSRRAKQVANVLNRKFSRISIAPLNSGDHLVEILGV